MLALLCACATTVAVLVVGPESAPAAKSRTVTAERGVVQSTVSGSGTVEAPQTDVNFASAGQLTDVKVKAGQHVVKGQVLAHIKSLSADLSLQQAEANLSSAEAKLTEAEAQGTTSSSQGATGPGNSNSSNTSSATSQASKAAAVATAQADVASASAAVQSAQQAVADTALTAPVSGTVASVGAGVGDYVSGGGSSNGSASSQSNGSSNGSGASTGNGSSNGSSSSSSSNSSSSSSSSAFVVIVDMSHLNLVVPFSESDIHKVKLHQSATVTVNALPEEKLAAHVTAIDTLPTTNNSVTSYNVTFRLDQQAGGLKPGMTASASVVVQRVENVVNVATAAISRGGGGSTVMLVRGGKSGRQNVTTGIAGDATTQVLSGLNAGDQVEIAKATGGGSGGNAAAGAGGAARFGGGGLGGGLGGGGGGFPGGGGPRGGAGGGAVAPKGGP